MADRAPQGGVLSMVGTPIGNLFDASPRALDTLRASDLLLCEDTRVTAKLLAHFGIRSSLMRCDENVIASRVDEVLGRLRAGERVAFVSDAGMPGISDPGQRLVDAALDAGLAVEVVPGPSAVTCAVLASGIACDGFFFGGFLPRRKGERAQRLLELAPVPGMLVFFESPHRVVATLASIAEAMPARTVALVRELTKVHEEVVRGPAPELARTVAGRGEVRGECVVVVGPPCPAELEALRGPAAGAVTLEQAVTAGLAAGEAKSALARRLSREFHVPRSEAYDRILELLR